MELKQITKLGCSLKETKTSSQKQSTCNEVSNLTTEQQCFEHWFKDVGVVSVNLAIPSNAINKSPSPRCTSKMLPTIGLPKDQLQANPTTSHVVTLLLASHEDFNYPPPSY